MSDHPLITLLLDYLRHYDSSRELHRDLGNLDFHKNYGLFINGPVDWPYFEALQVIIDQLTNSEKQVLVIYGGTEEYRIASAVVDEDNELVKYISWHEVYYAMNTVNTDIRPIKHIKDILGEADLVLFVGASRTMSDIIDHIRTYCTNCLLLLG